MRTTSNRELARRLGVSETAVRRAERAGRTVSFTFAGGVTVAAGDRLSVSAPGSPDASLADLSITLKGTRS